MDERSQQLEARLELPMLIAALLVVPLLIIEQHGASDSLRDFAYALNWTIWLAFLGEAIAMLTVVPDRWGWIRAHPLEVIVILGTAPVLPPTMQALRALRLLRLLRLALLAKRLRRLFTPGGLSYAAVVSALLVLGGGAALRVAEPALGLSLVDASWWAMTTATTVGYGDIYPRTDAGRAIAAVVMVIGIGFIALVTAALARQFVEPELDAVRDEDDEALLLLRQISARLDALEGRLAED